MMMFGCLCCLADEPCAEPVCAALAPMAAAAELKRKSRRLGFTESASLEMRLLCHRANRQRTPGAACAAALRMNLFLLLHRIELGCPVRPCIRVAGLRRLAVGAHRDLEHSDDLAVALVGLLKRVAHLLHRDSVNSRIALHRRVRPVEGRG